MGNQLMMRRAASVVLLAPVVLLTACQCFTPCDATKTARAAVTARNQGYGLLYQTVADESQVDQVLIIKNPDPPVAELIKAIAQFARDTKNKLQALAEEDSTLVLTKDGLPKAETKTRDAISDATAKQIIFSGGKEFEFRILLTQHQALNYITHLAEAIGAQDTHRIRKHYIAQVAEESKALHQKVIALMEAPYVDQSK
ncbi:MAG: hypothetical protein IT443_00305 [Phycisphaeraceae bacterium]|nr:hypothetical protein [Phycisphaeraceae bacterium]